LNLFELVRLKWLHRPIHARGAATARRAWRLSSFSPGVDRRFVFFEISIGFQLDSNLVMTLSSNGNNIEAGAAQAYFSPVNMALQRVKASVIFFKYHQRPSVLESYILK
jgi:hypothetical protein